MIEHLDFKRIIHLTIMEFSEDGLNCDIYIYIHILYFIFMFLCPLTSNYCNLLFLFIELFIFKS